MSPVQINCRSKNISLELFSITGANSATLGASGQACGCVVRLRSCVTCFGVRVGTRVTSAK